MRKLTMFLMSGIISCSVFAQCNFASFISPGSSTSFCTGGTVTLTASAGDSYRWSNGLTTQTIVVNNPGDYTVTVTTAGCAAASKPLTVSPSLTWSSIGCGVGSTMTVKSDGTLWGWGYNAYGNLGNGNTTNTTVPAQIGTGTTWYKVACGLGHGIGLKYDGTLWGWGMNSSGQIGDGSSTTRLSPVQIGTDNTWVSIACGDLYTFAIKSDGSLWAWGKNDVGQLGDGTIATRRTPVQIAAAYKWAHVSCGVNHTLAVRADGTLWAWGSNNLGQLGDGSGTNKLSPIQIGFDNNWALTACGELFTMAVKTDGSLWAWGNNDNGQFGNGTVTGSYIPVQIGIDLNWTNIVCGSSFTVAQKTGNILWFSGNNTSGQSGLGHNGFVNTFTEVTGAGAIPLMDAGPTFTAISKDDGFNFCMAGANTYGQLGDGSTTNRNTFGCVLKAYYDITTGAVTTSTCPGQAISIPFTTGGTFQAGNTFTAQLSDASGNFSGPATLGTLSGTTSGTINGTIPGGTSTGSAYRIRVVSACYAVNGSDNGGNINITKPDITITASGPTSFCAGGTVTLTAGGGSSYAWSDGSTGSSITVSPVTTTTYLVTGTNAQGCTNIASINIEILPGVLIIPDPASVCKGQPITLTAGGSSAGYRWSNGSTNASITVTPTKNTAYCVTGTAAAGCSNTDCVTVTVNAIPRVGAVALPNKIKAGQNSKLTASGAATYEWSDGLGSLNPVTVTPAITTTYTVTGTDANGCGNTKTVKVTVNP